MIELDKTAAQVRIIFHTLGLTNKIAVKNPSPVWSELPEHRKERWRNVTRRLAVVFGVIVLEEK